MASIAAAQLSSKVAVAGVSVTAGKAKASPVAAFSVTASAENKVSFPAKLGQKLAAVGIAAAITLAPLSAEAGVQLVEAERKKPFQKVEQPKGSPAAAAGPSAPKPARDSSEDSPLPFIIAFPALVFGGVVAVGALVPKDGDLDILFQKQSGLTQGYAGNEVELKTDAGKKVYKKK